MRTAFWMTVTTLMLVSLAGCLSADNTPTGQVSEEEYLAGFTQGTWPSGQNARDLIESYIMTHPFRSSQPQYADFMATARDDLEAFLVAAGLTVERQEYENADATGINHAGVNILGFQEGTVNPDQWVVLSAHYDSASNAEAGLGPTFYGAWDDGAGTAALMELAVAHADWDFPFTVVYAFFDQEEEGLLGSKAFVNEYFQDGTHDLLANINTDPPGLNWPCGDEVDFFPVKIIEQTEKVENASLPRYAWLHDGVMAGLEDAAVPPEYIDFTAGIPVATFRDPNDLAPLPADLPSGVRGTSDHASFGRFDVANVYVGSLPSTIVNGDPNDHDAAVLTYGMHTPLDTLQQMEARCTQGSLAEGLQTTVDIFSHTLTHLSQHRPPLI